MALSDKTQLESEHRLHKQIYHYRKNLQVWTCNRFDLDVTVLDS